MRCSIREVVSAHPRGQVAWPALGRPRFVQHSAGATVSQPLQPQLADDCSVNAASATCAGTSNGTHQAQMQPQAVP